MNLSHKSRRCAFGLLLLCAPLLASCGLAAGIALTKAQCETQGNYWDEVEGCRPQEETPATADETTTGTDTAPTGDTATQV